MKDKIINISFENTKFNCPYCGKKFIDINDKYLNRCNKNKSFNTKIKCECKNIFGMTYDWMSNPRGFKLHNHE